MSASCHQEGIVSRIVPGGRAVVSIRRAEACRSCSSQAACIALGARVAEVEIEVANDLGARPGERVRLVLPESDVVMASLVVYLVPAVALLAGALIGREVAAGIVSAENPYALLGGALGLIAGLAGSRFLSRRLTRGARYAPHLTSVARDPSHTNGDDSGSQSERGMGGTLPRP